MIQTGLLIFFSQIIFSQIPIITITNESLETEDAFGYFVAMNDNFAAVGTPSKDDQTGGLYIYKNDGEAWELHSNVLPQNIEIGDLFGWSCAMSENYLLVGAPTDHWGSGKAGRAFIYTLQNDQWVQQSTLVPPSGFIESAFGTCTHISEDIAIVGAPDYGGPPVGAVIIYRRNGEIWEEEQVIKPTFDSSIFALGSGASVSQDWMAISGFQDSQDGRAHTALMYRYENGTWNFKQQIIGPVTSGSSQIPSYAVDLSGEQLLFGTHKPYNNLGGSGGIFTYTYNGAEWVLTQDLRPDGFELDEIGRHVSQSENFAIVGASKNPTNEYDSAHHVLIYDKAMPNEWNIIGDFKFKNSSLTDWQGFNMDITNQYGIIGSSENFNEHGVVYIFDLRTYLSSDVQLISADAIQVYPNPSTDLIRVEMDEAIENIELYALSGKLLHKNTNKDQISVKHLPPGNYWLKIFTADAFALKQIVKID